MSDDTNDEIAADRGAGSTETSASSNAADAIGLVGGGAVSDADGRVGASGVDGLAATFSSARPMGSAHKVVLPFFGLVGADRLTRVARGTTLALEDASPPRFVLLVSGLLKQSRSLPDGRSQILGLCHPGDMIVPDSTCRNWPHSVTSVTRSIVFTLDMAAFEQWRSAEPSVDALLLGQLQRTSARAHRHLVTLGRKSPAERLASFLIELLQHQSRTRQQDDPITIPLLRIDIADYLGLESETVSRAFTHLRRHRLIELRTPRRVRVTDARSLERLARCEISLDNRA